MWVYWPLFSAAQRINQSWSVWCVSEVRAFFSWLWTPSYSGAVVVARQPFFFLLGKSEGNTWLKWFRFNGKVLLWPRWRISVMSEEVFLSLLLQCKFKKIRQLLNNPKRLRLTQLYSSGSSTIFTTCGFKTSKMQMAKLSREIWWDKFSNATFTHKLWVWFLPGAGFLWALMDVLQFCWTLSKFRKPEVQF